MFKSKILVYSLAVAAILMSFSTAFAQGAYPNRVVKIVVPLGPGSATDSLTRVLAESLRAELKTDVIVENKAGAGGVIGADHVAKSKADGYTIGVFHSSVLTASAAISPNLPYDPRKDFTPIAIIASNPIALAVPADSPFKTLEDYVAAAKKEPGKYNCGFIGIGSHSQFNLELLNIDAGVQITSIPFAGGTGPLLNGIMGKQVDSASALWAAFAPQVRAGKLRLLATGQPIKDMPLVPTFASRGYPRVNLDVLSVVVGPPGLPHDVATTLTNAFEKIANDPKNAASIANLGFQMGYGSPERLSKYIVEETRLLTEVARMSNMKPN
jgi:hypothetical protein